MCCSLHKSKSFFSHISHRFVKRQNQTINPVSFSPLYPIVIYLDYSQSSVKERKISADIKPYQGHDKRKKTHIYFPYTDTFTQTFLWEFETAESLLFSHILYLHREKKMYLEARLFMLSVLFALSDILADFGRCSTYNSVLYSFSMTRFFHSALF